MSKEEKSWFPKWVTEVWKKREPPVTVLKIPDQMQPIVRPSNDRRPDPTKAHPALITGLDPLIVGRYIRFNVPGTDRTFIGAPLKFLPGHYQQSVIEPGARNPLGVPGIWVNDNDAKGNLDWSDDPQQGLFCDCSTFCASNVPRPDAPAAMWKQQVHLNKLPVPGCTKTHTVVLHSQLAAQGIQLVPDFSSNFRVGMIKQPYR